MNYCDDEPASFAAVAWQQRQDERGRLISMYITEGYSEEEAQEQADDDMAYTQEG